MSNEPGGQGGGIWDPGALSGTRQDASSSSSHSPPSSARPAVAPTAVQPVRSGIDQEPASSLDRSNATDSPARHVPGPVTDPTGHGSGAPGTNWSFPVLLVAVLAVLALVGISILVNENSSRGSLDIPTAETAPGLSRGSTSAAADGSTTSDDSEPVPARSSAADDPEQVALATLDDIRREGLQQVTPQGQWVAQLASKAPGILDPQQTTSVGSHIFWAGDILAEHLALRDGDNLGATVVLLLSTDYGKRELYEGQPLWVTFAIGDFSGSVDVQQWCAERFPSLSGDALKNSCAPRRLKAIHA